MIKRVLIVSAVVFLLGLIAFWLLSGGIGATARTAKNFLNPVDLIFGSGTSTGISFRLPWQPAELTSGPDISGSADEADQFGEGTQAEERAAIEARYGPEIAQVSDPRTFGNPSPYVGQVTFTDLAAAESDPAKEYVVLGARANNGAPIPISGWSLQSAVSGLRISIPQGAPLFTLGVVNASQPVYLEPGASSVITTGPSPVGTSFRENICSGYLNELQSFAPELPSECPSPSDALPLNADNLRTYGGTCVDFVRTLSQCHFPSALPSSLSPSCRSFITNTLSYNGCVRMYGGKQSFALPSWRVYLGLRSGVWADTHDVIRLLDDKGRIVDVLTY